MKRENCLLIIAGPSAVGKTTVAYSLIERDPRFEFVRSVTTRPRRGDAFDNEYIYITIPEFRELIKNGGVLEHTEYAGNFYGTPKKEAEEVLASGKNLILEIEVEGARNVKARYPEAILILLLPPSFATQEARLRGRGTETEEKILARLAQTKNELLEAEHYDYVVYNHDGADRAAADEIRAILTAERASLRRNAGVAERYFAN